MLCAKEEKRHAHFMGKCVVLSCPGSLSAPAAAVANIHIPAMSDPGIYRSRTRKLVMLRIKHSNFSALT